MTADEKARALETFEELFNRGNLDIVEEVVHPDFVNHEAAPGRPGGPQGMRETVTWLRAAFPDLAFTVEDAIAEDDRIAARVRVTGTHEGEFMGIPPTGRSFSVQHIHIYRLAEGKIIEHWANRDDVGHMAQPGLMEEPRNPR